ncbi:MAG: SDR family oxidoreductase [Bacteroidales bacterium]|nr:SDR family oxidoreductase [Bacteroidales bacterium]
MKRNIDGKVVVITGASSGIGLACARVFHQKGAKLVLAARSEEVIKALADEINGDGEIRAIAVKTDVAVESDCKNLIEKAVDAFGQIDILINNAGVSMRANFADVELDVLRRLMDINFWGTVYCTKYAFPYIIANKGSIVGVSSVAGIHGMPCRTGYSASKYAVQGFLDAIRIETRKKDVQVMVVVPGFISTNVRRAALVADGSAQGESPRNENKMMSPEELARRIVKGIRNNKRQFATSYEGWFTPIVSLFLPQVVDKIYYNHMKREPNSPLE